MKVELGRSWRRQRAHRCSLRALSLLLLSALGPALAQSPDQVGQWSTVQTWPIVSVHAQLLPTGKVMFYPYSDGPRCWDPVTGSITNLSLAGYNLFCSGFSFLADGRLLVSGGHIEDNIGLRYASTYNAFTNTWTRLPDMNGGRWYPTNLTLANGDVLTISGDNELGANNDVPQVWQVASNSWRSLTSARSILPLYPKMFLAPNGKAFYGGWNSRYLDTAGKGAWSAVALQQLTGRDNYGPAVMYDVGKILCAGGSDPPYASCEAIDLNAASPAWRMVGSMLYPRRQNNLTVLPDGKVLVTGGSSGEGWDNASSPVLVPELWDPGSDRWMPMASAARYRGYHSIALLLPDGRVLSSGGDDQPNAEIYSPPYLFRGPRPTIASAPASVSYGQTFYVGSPDGAGIASIAWISLPAVTHTHNMTQRFMRLAFTQAAGGLNVTAPPNGNVSPPGWYLLFLVNSTGVPSVAKMVQIGGSAPPPSSGPAPPSNLTATVVSSTRIDLSWNDNSADESGFKIEQSRDNTSSFTQVATVGAGSTTYPCTGLTANHSYYFRVRAYNATGNSAYSNTASAKTPKR